MSSTIARAGLATLALSLLLACGVAAQESPGKANEDTRIAPAPAPSAPAPAPLPPLVMFSRSSSGWSANLSFADPVTEIQWSLAKDGPYESTGFLRVFDPLTRRPMANTGIVLESHAPVIYVRYADLEGNWTGPFAVPFDPVAETRRFYRDILETTPGAWLAFRSSAPNILYYTHISGYRCAIREFRLGLDTTEPDRIVKLAPCDMRDPTATPRDVDTHLWIDPAVQFASAQVVYQDGTVSKIRLYRR